jgi:hypothetical protein
LCCLVFPMWRILSPCFLQAVLVLGLKTLGVTGIANAGA